MANGSAEGPCIRCYLAFAATVLIVLVAAGVWNPFPRMWDWVNQTRPLSNHEPAWQVRLGSAPKSVTIAGGAVIVEHRTTVEARSISSGEQLWERKADWSAVAGEQNPVVAAGQLLVKGYDVLDATTGGVRRHDGDAVAVWTYRNAVLDANCFDPNDCVLNARDPGGAAPLWTAELPGIGAGLSADNPEVLGTRQLTAAKVEPHAGGPDPMPPVMGLPVDGRIQVVNTATGGVLQEVQPEHNERVVVVGGRVLRIVARPEDGTCYFTVRAIDPANGQKVWSKTGINLRTADGAGCPQRQDPQGGLNVVVGVGADRREVVIDAYDGRTLWSGEEGQKLLAVDDQYALVRAADGRSLEGHQLGSDGPAWNRPIDKKGEAALARYAAIVIDRSPDRIIALEPLTGRELVNVRSSARVLAVGPAGMVIGEGRHIAYVPFNGTAPEGSTNWPPPVDGDTGGKDENIPCGGPKEPVCHDSPPAGS